MSTLPTLEIRSSVANYAVGFSDRVNLSDWHPRADLLLVDSFFRDRLSFPPDVPVVWIEASEEAKALDATLPVFMQLKQAGLGRDSHLAAIGGGVIQDIATFVCSLYMRGISWSYIPTTFLGMTDSCLGGKSSINAGPYKNLVGNFYPPCDIIIMPVFARTLPAVEIAGGAAEAAKIAFCRGSDAFAAYENLVAPVLAGDWHEQQLLDLLYATLNVKRWFIETDEFDRAERRLLNYGHTWGHALESATGFAIPHGLAVAIGMMASICFVEGRSGKPVAPPLWRHCLTLLTPVLESHQLEQFNSEKFAHAFRADKKHSSRFYHVVVPDDLNQCDLGVREIRLPVNDSSLREVVAAMRQAIDVLRRAILSSQLP